MTTENCNQRAVIGHHEIPHYAQTTKALNRLVLSAMLIVGSYQAVAGPAEATGSGQQVVVTSGSDQVTIYGQPYFAELGDSAPLILLFHQGGSNGRGEYEPIVPWLNQNGFRAIAWDQRAGGQTHGMDNRTVAGLSEGVPTGYCDAYNDLQAALDYVKSNQLADKVIVWGSSYSGSLVFRLAAENPDAVVAVIAFSPASGGPLVDCRARMWVDQLEVPMFAARPDSEMAREASQEQREILSKAGVEFLVVDNGRHGSSMLVDERTEHDMSKVRAKVIQWLGRVAEK